jgi:nucleotide-binding universal stress UspA family protein
MYKRILLAYDGTREGIVALREGALLAKRCGARVFLLSVLPETDGMWSGAVYADVVRRQTTTYEELLARGVEALEKFGLNPVSRLVVGEPVPQIGAFAAEVGADLVVLGHRRQNLLQRWWSGSTSAYLTDHVRCSVLIGRNEIEDDAFAAEMAKADGAQTAAVQPAPRGPASPS